MDQWTGQSGWRITGTRAHWSDATCVRTRARTRTEKKLEFLKLCMFRQNTVFACLSLECVRSGELYGVHAGEVMLGMLEQNALCGRMGERLRQKKKFSHKKKQQNFQEIIPSPPLPLAPPWGGGSYDTVSWIVCWKKRKRKCKGYICVMCNSFTLAWGVMAQQGDLINKHGVLYHLSNLNVSSLWVQEYRWGLVFYSVTYLLTNLLSSLC